MCTHGLLSVRSRPSVGRCAFTLIEVLVVVAIIALLVAILLPSLNRARSSARNVQCLSNLRQSAVSMHTFATQNKDFIPRGGNADTLHWTMVVAKEMQYLKAYPRLPNYTTLPAEISYDVNAMRIDQMPVFHCPERVGTLPHPWVDYVVNATLPRWPFTNSNWEQVLLEDLESLSTRQYSRITTYKRPAEVIWLADAENEQKNIEFEERSSFAEGRSNWHARHFGGSYNISTGGIDIMDFWMGAHMPQGKNKLNVSDLEGPRRIARKMHMNRFTNAAFFDAHAAGIPLQNPGHAPGDTATNIRNYGFWLKLSGVKNWEEAALKDSGLGYAH